MIYSIHYTFSTKIWKHTGAGGWHFVSLPIEISEEIRQNLKWQEEGWGRLKAEAKINNLRWQTAIWFDTKQSTYLLPIKSEIRKKENLNIDQMITISIYI